MTLCGSIYVRLVFSSFLMLPLIKVGVTLENSHINSSLCFRHSSNSNYWLIIFIFAPSFRLDDFILFLDNKKNQPDLFSDWFLYQFCSISSNRYVIGGDEESRTPVQYLFHINFSECSLLINFLKSSSINKPIF